DNSGNPFLRFFSKKRLQRIAGGRLIEYTKNSAPKIEKILKQVQNKKKSPTTFVIGDSPIYFVCKLPTEYCVLKTIR
ncbi:hypothetical protein AAGV33_15745, partial [Flavobacterium sp. FBOR7N2.3]